MNIKNGSSDKFKKLRELTEGNYKAFLYDCDGTLADNMDDHKETYVQVSAQKGVELDPGIVEELAGYPITAVVEEINKRYYFRMQDFYEITQRLKENKSCGLDFKAAFSEFNWIHNKGNSRELNEKVQFGRILGFFSLEDGILDTNKMSFEPSEIEVKWSCQSDYNKHHQREYYWIIRQGLGI
jgi:hypothetical protein